MKVTKELKNELVKQYGKSENDTGSTEVQCAILTHEINYLSKIHLKSNVKDFATKRSLIKKVNQRKRLLKYLKVESGKPSNQSSDGKSRYETLIASLGLRG